MDTGEMRGAFTHTQNMDNEPTTQTNKQGVSIYVLLSHKEEPLPGQHCSDAARHAQTRLMSLPHAPGRIHVRRHDDARAPSSGVGGTDDNSSH